jgi:intracellular sulfur oxidation DsrE/DsrF family protein
MSDPKLTPRRGFLGHVAAGAAALGIGSALPAPLAAATSTSSPARDPKLEAWFGKLNGKHRMVFDSPAPHEGMIAIWPRVYLNTMNETHGEKDGASAMIILRHHSLGLAIQDSMWEKYEFGKVFHVDVNGQPATKNPFAKIEGLPITGLGITELLASGVLVGACDVAMTVYSSGVAKARGLDAAAVRKEWVDALHPGVQLVPSGVYAVGRAQELGCGYCFAG